MSRPEDPQSHPAFRFARFALLLDLVVWGHCGLIVLVVLRYSRQFEALDRFHSEARTRSDWLDFPHSGQDPVQTVYLYGQVLACVFWMIAIALCCRAWLELLESAGARPRCSGQRLFARARSGEKPCSLAASFVGVGRSSG